MSWTNFFDKIYVINLAKRTDRMQQAKDQLKKYNIPFERWEAIENKDGAEGLRLTMIELFTHCIENNYQNCLIFEDDLHIIDENINEVMDEVVQQIPFGWEIVYLGCQLCVTPQRFLWRNLIYLRKGYATHAAAYSIKAMKFMLEKGIGKPFDNWIVDTVQPRDQSFVVFPMLVSQIVSKSDIYSDADFMDWKPHLEIKYNRQIEKMKEMGKFIREPKNN